MNRPFVILKSEYVGMIHSPAFKNSIYFHNTFKVSECILNQMSSETFSCIVKTRRMYSESSKC